MSHDEARDRNNNKNKQTHKILFTIKFILVYECSWQLCLCKDIGWGQREKRKEERKTKGSKGSSLVESQERRGFWVEPGQVKTAVQTAKGQNLIELPVYYWGSNI